MNLDKIPMGLRHEYTQICPICTMEMKILTQHHNLPEYETEVYVQCQCGNYLEFILPVN
jgi:C4-type Zn-finger protein